jgi:hypothetical protein
MIPAGSGAICDDATIELFAPADCCMIGATADIAWAIVIASSTTNARRINTWCPLSISGTSTNARFPGLAPNIGSVVRSVCMRAMIWLTTVMSGMAAKTVNWEFSPALLARLMKKLLVPPLTFEPGRASETVPTVFDNPGMFGAPTTGSNVTTERTLTIVGGGRRVCE